MKERAELSAYCYNQYIVVIKKIILRFCLNMIFLNCETIYQIYVLFLIFIDVFMIIFLFCNNII